MAGQAVIGVGQRGIKAADKRTRQVYGAEKLQHDLAEHGIRVGICRIKRIRRKLGIRCKQKRKFKATTNSEHIFPIAENILERFGLKASMSRKGNCYDNAPMESFWGTLKQELVHHRRYRTRQEAIRDITEYIEVFYNRQRLQPRLGFLSPAVYEQRYYAGLVAA